MDDFEKEDRSEAKKKKSRVSFFTRLIGLVAFVYILIRVFLVIIKLVDLGDYSWVKTFDIICDYIVLTIFGLLALIFILSGKKRFIVRIILLVILGVSIAFLFGFLPQIKNWISSL